MLHSADPFTELLILQSTPFCNVDCRYCYLPDRTDRRRMTPEVIDAVFAAILPSRLARDHLTVVWHAGEPLALPPSYYDAAFRAAERHRPGGLHLQHNFQSNGTLLNPSWIDFLARTGATIGLSIDGPAALHDVSRRTRGGTGTHARAMRGLRLLHDAGVRPHVITVLTDESLDHADALFDFYVDAGISDVSFNIEEKEGAHRLSTLEADGSETRFRRFLAHFLARMRADPGRISLRELRNAVSVLREGGLPAGSNQESEPMRIVSIDCSGAVSSFSPELLGMHDARYGDFTFGNVLHDPIETIIERVVGSSLHAAIVAGVAACQEHCAWFDFCRGASPANKLFELGTFSGAATMYCGLTRRSVLDVVLQALEQEQEGAMATVA